MSDDIVARLRAVLHNDRSVELMAREAADEIERLRKGGCARDQNTTQFCAEAVALQCEVERLRAERDEVRQSYCSLMEAYRGGDGRLTAAKLGWGYLFKENTNDQ